MKLFTLYLSAFIIVAFTSCKGGDNEADSADSGQVHVGASTVADSNKYPVSQTETGGQDTTAKGMGTATPNPQPDSGSKTP